VGVGSSPEEEEEEAVEGFARSVEWKQIGDEAAEQADRGDTDVVPEADEGEGGFEGAEVEGTAFDPGIAVECGEEELNGREAGSVNDDEIALLVEVGEHSGRGTSGRETEEELQRVDVNENGEEEGEVDPEGGGVVQTVAAEEVEVREPDEDEQSKADGEGREAEQDGAELVEGAGDGGRDHDERESEAEDDVGEVVDARAGLAAQAEAFVELRMV